MGAEIAGLVLLVAGALDPLEGSVLIATGGALAVLGAWLNRSRRRRLIYQAFVLLIAGIGAMLVLSWLGGIGGSTGRSMWWMLVVLPYPVGWILMLAGLILSFRDHRNKIRGAMAQTSFNSSGNPR